MSTNSRADRPSLNPLVMHKLAYDLGVIYEEVVEAPVPASLETVVIELLGGEPVSRGQDENKAPVGPSRLGRDSFQFR